MKIANPFQLNDWKMRDFLILILAVQLILVGLISTEALGFRITLAFRQIIGLIYLIIIPGSLILRILGLHNLKTINTFLYTVGLSLTLLMFTGFFMAIIFPLIGISKPISQIPLITTFSIVIITLSILSIFRDKEFYSPSYITPNIALSVPVLSFSLIPFMAVFGTYLVNYYNYNKLVMVLILIISIIPILVAWNRFIPENIYPFAIFIIALSLLYHNSLISRYLWGWDIHLEYYLANNVVIKSVWDPTITITVNSMLSTVMLAPIFSEICNMSLTWVFKIIYPFLFSLTSLGLYQIFKKQTNDTIAFLSCFFFISFVGFYTEMLALPRQQIAELYLVLIILLIVEESIERYSKSILLVLFSISLIVSHYALSYIFLFSIICFWLILNLIKVMKFDIPKESNGSVFEKFDLPYIILMICTTLAWYIYTSKSAAFITIIYEISQIFAAELLKTGTSAGLDTIVHGGTISLLHSYAKYLYLVCTLFISIGIISPIFYSIYSKYVNFRKDYYILSLTYFILCIFSIIIPYFLIMFSTLRMYQITLIFLAPFCVIGGFLFLRIFGKLSGIDFSMKISQKILALFLSALFLFNVGIIYEMANDHPTSISLSQENFKNSKYIQDRKVLFDCINTLQQDVVGAYWLREEIDQSNPINVYADYISSHPLTSYGAIFPDYIHPLINTTKKLESGTFLFLGYANIIENISIIKNTGNRFNTTDLSSLLLSINKIYSNGGSEIFVK